MFSAVIAVSVGGCAETSGKNGPGAIALPSGQSCQSIRGELNRLDSRGVPAKIEAAQSGKKLPAAQQAEVDQYNKLLGQYLGAKCHV
jgi:hypothetical protein